MIVALVLAVLVAQEVPADTAPARATSVPATPSPTQPLLGVVPPRGYTYANGLPVPKTYRLWTVGVKPNRSGIGVFLVPGYKGTSKDYAENSFLPAAESEKTTSAFQVTREQPVTVCGGPGWEMREAFTADEGSRIQISLFRATPKYVIVAHYQRPKSAPEDPLAVAAIHKLCPPKK